MPELELEEGELEASEIATGGIIKDDYGNTWTLPNSELGEDYSFSYGPLDLPRRDERFEYQFEKTDRLGWAISEKFVPVRRSEVGLVKLNDANRKLTDYGMHQGDELDPVHTVGDLTLCKIPKAIAAARRKRADQEWIRARKAVGEAADFDYGPPNARADVRNGRSGLKREWNAMGQRVEEDASQKTDWVTKKRQ
jgi:hypothetical protein